MIYFPIFFQVCRRSIRVKRCFSPSARPSRFSLCSCSSTRYKWCSPYVQLVSVFLDVWIFGLFVFGGGGGVVYVSISTPIMFRLFWSMFTAGLLYNFYVTIALKQAKVTPFLKLYTLSHFKTSDEKYHRNKKNIWYWTELKQNHLGGPRVLELET